MAIFALSYAAGIAISNQLTPLLVQGGRFQLGCTALAILLLFLAWWGQKSAPVALAVGLSGIVSGGSPIHDPAETGSENAPIDGLVTAWRALPDGAAELTVTVCSSNRPVEPPKMAIVTVAHDSNSSNLLGRQIHFAAALRPFHAKWNPLVAPSRMREDWLMAELPSLASIVTWNGDANPCDVGAMASLQYRLLRVAENLQATLAEQVKKVVPTPESELLTALAFGTRASLSADLEAAFRRLGISHILSVSGLHFAVLLWFLFGGLGPLCSRLPAVGRGRPIRWFFLAPALLLIWSYTLVVGAEVATVRSAWFVTLWLGAEFGFRPNQARAALWLTGWIILLSDRQSLFDPSFQLSFAATWALLYLAHLSWFTNAKLLPAPLTFWQKMARGSGQLFLCSLVATLATTPITAWHFAQFAPVGVVANLVFVPVFEWIALPCALLGGFVRLSVSWLGQWPLLIAGFVAHHLCRAIHLAAAHVGDGFVARPGMLVLLLWFLALLLFAHGKSKRGAASLWLIACLLWWGQTWAAQHRGAVRFTFLDIGQGDSALVELPYGRVWLVDGGGSFDPLYDPGEKILAKVLHKKGIERIDRLIITHPHPDHANGLLYVVQHFPINEIWYSGERTGLPAVLSILAEAKRRQIPVHFPTRFGRDAVTVEPLGPRREDGSLGVRPGWHENDNSLVLLFSFHGRKVLLTGDIESSAEQAIAQHPIGVVDVLKVPHHGSKTSSTAAFVVPLQPRLAVASLGFGNRWHFPHAEVLRRYRDLGTRFLRTDESGAVTVDIAESGRLCWHTERNPSELCDPSF